MFAAAFYKAARPGLPGIANRLIRVFEGGPYSHVELVFSDGAAASSSLMDGGVRFAGMGYGHPAIDFGNGNWDLVPLPAFLEPQARAWFRAHEGWSYDLRGVVRHLWPWGNRDSKQKAHCIEAVLAALEVPEPWRFGVNAGAAVCRTLAGFSLPGLMALDGAL